MTIWAINLLFIRTNFGSSRRTEHCQATPCRINHQKLTNNSTVASARKRWASTASYQVVLAGFLRYNMVRCHCGLRGIAPLQSSIVLLLKFVYQVSMVCESSFQCMQVVKSQMCCTVCHMSSHIEPTPGRESSAMFHHASHHQI